MSKMSVAEQARIFSETAQIVAPNGSALANLVFANPACSVVEFFAPGWVVGYNWMICANFGLPYTAIVGKGPRPGPGVIAARNQAGHSRRRRSAESRARGAARPVRRAADDSFLSPDRESERALRRARASVAPVCLESFGPASIPRRNSVGQNSCRVSSRDS